MQGQARYLFAALLVVAVAAVAVQSWRLRAAERFGAAETARADDRQANLESCDAAFRPLSERLRRCQMLSNLRPGTFETEFEGYRYIGKTDNLIDYHVLRYGAYEKPLLLLLEGLSRGLERKLGQRPVFVDVGANVGHHSLYMSRRAAKVLAIEPYPPVLERFRRMVGMNGIANIQIAPVALGARPERVPFEAPPDSNQGSGSFVPVSGSASHTQQHLEFDVVTGDRLLADLDYRRVDMIKMDIEGYEKQALLGLRETIVRDRPVVVVEVTIDSKRPHAYHSLDEFVRALPENYRCKLLTYDYEDMESGHYAIAALPTGSEDPAQLNLVAYPADHQQLVDGLGTP